MSQSLEKRRVGKGNQAATTESWESRGDRGVRNRLPYKYTRQPRLLNLLCFINAYPQPKYTDVVSS